MPDDVDSIVADNRRQIRDQFGRFIEVDEGRTRDLKFGVSFIGVEVETSVDTRTTGDQIVLGHSDESKGFGRGTFGDDKGSWEPRGLKETVDYGSAVAFGIWATENSFGIGTFGDDKSDFGTVNTAQTSVAFTRSGRRVISELIAGSEDGITTVRYGSDDTPAELSDDALNQPVSSVSVSSRNKPQSNTSHVRGVFPSTEFYASNGETESFEIGVESSSGKLAIRATVDVDVDSTDEVRVGFITTFEGEGVGTSVITNDGEAAFADAFNVPGRKVEFSKWVFGRTTGTPPDETTTALPDEVFDIKADATSDRNRAIITGSVEAETDVPPTELPTPISQVGIVDDSDRLVWVTPSQDIAVTEQTEFNVEAFFRTI